ncbi:MAG TPA: hypothetical protein VE973_03585 [Candidatus Limnocylindria bacterium]|nr:hypothetical protein [Candidatus Limnocylindria bacterium]
MRFKKSGNYCSLLEERKQNEDPAALALLMRRQQITDAPGTGIPSDEAELGQIVQDLYLHYSQKLAGLGQ